MYDRRHLVRGSVQRSVGSAGGVGKRTLTGELEALEPLEPVQMEGESPRAVAEVHSAAARGTASPATAMPHGERIQALFGPRHDLSQVQAHVGGDTAAQMGATAYATGNHVVFDRAPDLHTAAHEAAHVVQQAHGVHLTGGVGSVGDAYEQHADAVADRVVAGQSAADLLGDGGPLGAGSRAVQRKPEKLTAEQNKKFCDEGEKQGWIHCGKDSDHKPQISLAVRHSEKDDAPRMREDALSTDGEGHAIVEDPPSTVKSDGPYVTFYLIHGDGTPIRGGKGLLGTYSKETKEHTVDIDLSAATQISSDTRAVVVTKAIDNYTKTVDPKHAIPILEAAKLGDRVTIRIDYGTADGSSGIYKAKAHFPGDGVSPDLEYDASRLNHDGNSFTDFLIDGKEAAGRIGNLQDSVRRKAATVTLIMPAEDKKSKK